MSLPYFYVPQLDPGILVLEEDQSKHMIQVLRMQIGEAVLLTDGRGKKARATIKDDNRKRCAVVIATIEQSTPAAPHTAIGISLVKNASRFEWFLEKAAELGIHEIIPLLCSRTEKEKFRHDRLKAILVSAMLQSQQSRMPVLQEPMEFSKALLLPYEQRFIAHCLPEEKRSLSGAVKTGVKSKVVLIGPEGDFTEAEIREALEHQYLPVSLGETRLRTETAGMAAAVLLKSLG